MYGQSADVTSEGGPDESFEDAVRRVKSQRSNLQSVPGHTKWTPPVLQALLEEVVARHGGRPTSWDRKEANRLHREWSAACLQGLDDDEAILIKWIKLSGGHRPMLAAELSKAGITSDEAALQLGYNGQIDRRWPSIFGRYRDRKINRSEAIAAVRRWREAHVTG
jgi:hypothetical protein